MLNPLETAGRVSGFRSVSSESMWWKWSFAESYFKFLIHYRHLEVRNKPAFIQVFFIFLPLIKFSVFKAQMLTGRAQLCWFLTFIVRYFTVNRNLMNPQLKLFWLQTLVSLKPRKKTAEWKSALHLVQHDQQTGPALGFVSEPVPVVCCPLSA